jgi:hypothetical protein
MRGGAVAGGRRHGRPPDGASCSRRAGLQQCKSFVEMCIVSCLSASPACECGRGASTWDCPRRCLPCSRDSPVPLYCSSSVCCLLVLNSVTSTPQWICQPMAAWGCVWCLCLSVSKYVLGHSRVSQPPNSGYASSGTLAFSLRRMPPRPATDDAVTHTGSSAVLRPTNCGWL